MWHATAMPHHRVNNQHIQALMWVIRPITHMSARGGELPAERSVPQARLPPPANG